MAGIYRGAFDGISVTNDSDQNIWALTAGSADKIVVHEIMLTSAATTAEILNITLRRETTAAAGTTVTPSENDEGNTTTTTATMITLDLTPGTPGDVLANWQWEQLGPLHYLPTPETRPVIQESGILVMHLGTALAATTAMSGWVVWQEL
jgi:hypothetical protein